MAFRNCPCDCREPHTWAINIIDHHTKYVYVSPLINKTADEVLRVIKMYCYTYGFPKMILTDNGRNSRTKKWKHSATKIGSSKGMALHVLPQRKVLWREQTDHGKKT